MREFFQSKESPQRPSMVIVARRFLGVLSEQERKLWWGSLITAALSSLLLIAVGIVRHVERVPKTGGEYTEAVVGSPHTINPLFAATNDAERDLQRLLYAGLVKPPNGQRAEVELDLGQSLTVSNDGLTYTVTLKPNLQWHDGKPLMANDILFTIKSILNPDWKSSLAGVFKGVEVSSSDEKTVTFRLSQPSATFTAALSVGILPEHLWKNVLPANARMAELNIKPIGAGPFRFESLKKDKEGALYSYTVERNPYYASITTPPYLNRITLRFVEDAAAAYAALEKGEVEGANRVGSFLGKIPNLKPQRSFLLRLPQYTALFFNSSANELLKDPVIREALARSVDKQQIVADVLGGEAEVIHGPLLPGMLGFDQNITPLEYDLKKAKELLESSGWKKGKSKESKPMKLTVTTVDQKELGEIAQRIVTNWKVIGIDAQVAIVESEKFQTAVLNPRGYDVLLYGQQLGSTQDPYPFWHSSQVKSPGLNLAGLSHSGIDRLLEKARSAANTEERGNLYQQFQTQILAQLPAVFLFRPVMTYAVNPSIHVSVANVVTRSTDRWNMITQWYRKTKWSWK